MISVSGLQCLIQRDVIFAIMFSKAIGETKIARIEPNCSRWQLWTGVVHSGHPPVHNGHHTGPQRLHLGSMRAIFVSPLPY